MVKTQAQRITEFENQSKEIVDKTKKLQTKIKELEDKMLKANNLVCKFLISMHKFKLNGSLICN